MSLHVCCGSCRSCLFCSFVVLRQVAGAAGAVWAAEAAWANANKKVEMQQAAVNNAHNALLAALDTPMAQLAHQALQSANEKLKVGKMLLPPVVLFSCLFVTLGALPGDTFPCSHRLGPHNIRALPLKTLFPVVWSLPLCVRLASFNTTGVPRCRAKGPGHEKGCSRGTGSGSEDC